MVKQNKQQANELGYSKKNEPNPLVRKLDRSWGIRVIEKHKGTCVNSPISRKMPMEFKVWIGSDSDYFESICDSTFPLVAIILETAALAGKYSMIEVGEYLVDIGVTDSDLKLFLNLCDLYELYIECA